MFLDGTLLTVSISLLAFALALALGIAGATARRSRLLPVRALASAYVEFIRNTPVLVQMFFIFFALPSVGLRFSGFQAGVLALGINVGAYMTETIRGGLQGVPRAQYEAARVLALGRLQTFRHVILPQTLRNVYPAVVNLLVQVILGSSLLTALAVQEVTGTTLVLNNKMFRPAELFGIAMVIYLLLTNGVSLAADFVGRRAFKPPLVLPGRTALGIERARLQGAADRLRQLAGMRA